MAEDSAALISTMKDVLDALRELKAPGGGAGAGGAGAKDASAEKITKQSSVIARLFTDTAKVLTVSSTDMQKAFTDARKTINAITDPSKTIKEVFAGAKASVSKGITSAKDFFAAMEAQFKAVSGELKGQGAVNAAKTITKDLAIGIIAVGNVATQGLNKAKDAAANFAIGVSQKMDVAWGGAESAFASAGHDVAKGVSEVLPKTGMFLDGIVDVLVKAAMFFRKEQLAQAKMGVAVEAQLGTGQGAKSSPLAAEAWGYRMQIGMEASERLGTGLAQVGLTEAGMAEKTVQMSKQLNMEMGTTIGQLYTFSTLTNNATDAVDLMAKSYRAMQVVAQQTGASTEKMTKSLIEAGSNLRFMNVDAKVLSNTMQMFAKNQESIAAMGLSFKEDAGKGLVDLSTAMSGASDTMLAFYGMGGLKGGGEKDPISGWIKEKFGATSANTMHEGEGGAWTGVAGKDTEVFTQNLKAMKDTMMAAGEGKEGHDKMFAEYQMGKGLNLSDKAIRLLLTTGTGDIGKLAGTPQEADTFKEPKDLLHDLKDTATLTEAIQRSIAGLMFDSLNLGLQVLNVVSTGFNALINFGRSEEANREFGLAKTVAGVTTTDIGGDFSSLMESMKDSLPKDQLESFASTMSALRGSATRSEEGKMLIALGHRELDKEALAKNNGDIDRAKDILNGIDAINEQLTALGLPPIRKQASGSNAATGWNIVGDHGPELINFGGSSAEVFSNQKTESMMEGAASSSKGPSIGRQTVIHLTLNAGVLDRATFQDHLFNEIASALDMGGAS